MTEKEKFIAKTKTDENGCWIWQKALKFCVRGTHRYGWVTYKNKQMAAHRLAWVLFKDEQLTSSDYICHKCDVPSCVNPDHLFKGTPADNTQDMVKKGRQSKGSVRKDNGQYCATKLTAEQVNEIRNLLDEKVTQVKIAAMYGLNQSTVSHIKNGVSWND